MAKYISAKYYNDIQPKVLVLEKIRDEAYCNWKRAKRISLIHNPTPENVEKRQVLVPIFREAYEKYELMKYEEEFYHQVMSDVQYKIYEIQKQVLNYNNKVVGIIISNEIIYSFFRVVFFV